MKTDIWEIKKIRSGEQKLFINDYMYNLICIFQSLILGQGFSFG